MAFDTANRADRDARARRERARAHLERVRARRGRGPAPGPGARRRGASARPSRITALACFALALAAGAGAGRVLWARLPAWDGASGVRVIAVRGTHHLAPAEVAAATGVARGEALARVDPSVVARRLEGQPWIASAHVLRLPGGALVVDVHERRPVAAIALGKPPETYAVDAQGAPFAPADAESLAGLPRLVAAGPVAPREPSPRLAEAVRLAQRLPELGLALPDAVEIAADGDPQGYALRLPRLGARFVVGRDDLDDRLAGLARLLAERPDVVTAASDIDLRFADQVVLRTTPAPAGSAQATGGRGSATPSEPRPAG